MLLMLFSNNNFHYTNYTNNLRSVDVSVSINSNNNGPSICTFDKNFNFSFYNSSRLPYEVKKYQQIILLTKGSSNFDNINILLSLFSLNFLKEWKNDPF